MISRSSEMLWWLALYFAAIPLVAQNNTQSSSVLLAVPVDTAYSNESLDQIRALAQALPPSLAHIQIGETLSKFILRRYGFGKTNVEVSEVYEWLARNIVELNNLRDADTLDPGELLVPSLPRRALTQPNKASDWIAYPLIAQVSIDSEHRALLTSLPTKYPVGRRAAQKVLLVLDIPDSPITEPLIRRISALPAAKVLSAPLNFSPSSFDDSTIESPSQPPNVGTVNARPPSIETIESNDAYAISQVSPLAERELTDLNINEFNASLTGFSRAHTLSGTGRLQMPSASPVQSAIDAFELDVPTTNSLGQEGSPENDAAFSASASISDSTAEPSSLESSSYESYAYNIPSSSTSPLQLATKAPELNVPAASTAQNESPENAATPVAGVTNSNVPCSSVTSPISPDQFRLTPDLGTVVTKALQSVKRPALLLILDSGWPSPTDATESREFLKATLEQIHERFFKTHFILEPLDDQEEFVDLDPSDEESYHAARIAESIAPFRELDQFGFIKVIYVPYARRQGGSNIIVNLLKLYFAYWAANFTQTWNQPLDTQALQLERKSMIDMLVARALDTVPDSPGQAPPGSLASALWVLGDLWVRLKNDNAVFIYSQSWANIGADYSPLPRALAARGESQFSADDQGLGWGEAG